MVAACDAPPPKSISRETSPEELELDKLRATTNELKTRLGKEGTKLDLDQEIEALTKESSEIRTETERIAADITKMNREIEKLEK